VREFPVTITRENLIMQNPSVRLAAPFLVVLLVLAGVAVQASDSEPPHGEAPAEEQGTEAHGGHARGTLHTYNREIALLIGITDESGHDSQGTLGLEYLHRMGKNWGMGAMVDYVGGNQRNWIIGVPFAYYPGGGWKLLVAPAVEFHRGRGEMDHGDGHGEIDEDETYFALRLGVAYDFAVSDHWRISPTVDLDFVDGHHVWIYGVNLNYAW
jgi:hypothetical protein